MAQQQHEGKKGISREQAQLLAKNPELMRALEGKLGQLQGHQSGYI